MSVVDLIEKQDQLIAHRYTFFLWPQKWSAYNLSDQFDWEIHPFQPDQVENIPSEPGVYSFVIQPGIASHPYCLYLMYIGKTNRTLRERFREYLREREDPDGRPKIVRLLNKYQGYTHFCCSAIEKKERIGDIEDALINALLPPCNDQFPAEVRRTIGAFQ
jgi:hypothetical protein